MVLNKIVAEFLRDAADKIENNVCGMTNEEIIKLASNIMHEKMNKTEAADYLNMSTRTFDRQIEKGNIPPGIHTRGNKNLIWYKDELVNTL